MAQALVAYMGSQARDSGAKDEVTEDKPANKRRKGKATGRAETMPGDDISDK